MDGRNGASSPAPQIRFGPPGGVNPTFFAPSLAEGPRRRHHLCSDCGCGGGRTVPNQKFLSMDDLLECKRQIEKSNAAGTSRDEDKQERLVQEIEVLMEDDKKSDQAQQFMVAIPSFICIGLILDRMRILVDSNILYICFLPATFYFSNCPHSSHHLPLTQYMVEKKCTIDKNNTHIIWITRYNTLVSC